MSDAELTVDELAELMFDAYNAAGPNPWKTFDGRDVPRWSRCGEQVQAKWAAAAKCAMNATRSCAYGTYCTGPIGCAGCAPLR